MDCLSKRQLAVGGLMVVLLCTGGCTTVAWETAKLLRESRGTEAQFTDSKISASLISGLSDIDFGLLMDVNTDVWETRVLLTGTVTDTRTRQAVLRKARSDKRIQKIYNEIQVVSQSEQNRRREVAQAQRAARHGGAEQPHNDFWIESKIAAQLISAKDVVSVNYRWRSVHQTLYVIGCAKNKQELAQVLDIMRTTSGVARVKSFVDIKPEETS